VLRRRVEYENYGTQNPGWTRVDLAQRSRNQKEKPRKTRKARKRILSCLSRFSRLNNRENSMKGQLVRNTYKFDPRARGRLSGVFATTNFVRDSGYRGKRKTEGNYSEIPNSSTQGGVRGCTAGPNTQSRYDFGHGIDTKLHSERYELKGLFRNRIKNGTG